MYEFGLGKLFSVNSDGTSVEFGTLQDVSFSFSFDKKELYGRNQYAVKVARGKAKTEGKAGFAQIKSAALNQILNGDISTGKKVILDPHVTDIVPAVTPFELTYTVPNTGTFGKMLSMYDVSDPSVATPMKLVTTAPNTGEYSIDVATKKFTFSSADKGKRVQYTFEYNVSTGKTITLTNRQMGTAPVFQIELFTQLDGKQLCLQLNACTTTKLDFNMKQEDFLIPGFDFSAFADSAEILGYLYLDE